MGESFKVQDHMTKFKAGDTITWQSAAAGTWVRKTGEVLAVIGSNEDMRLVLRRALGRAPKTSEMKASGFSLNDRYLVKVQPAAKKRPGAMRGYTDLAPVYYAPLVKVIDGTSAAAGKLVKAAER